jgi:tRNA dimethylallyltransferase
VLLVGGTGFYLRAAIEGLFEGPAADPTLRAALVAEAERDGRERLHARLAEVDPEAAARLSPNDLLRVVRALEIRELTGESQSAHHRKHRRAQPAVSWYAIDVPRETLYGRIAVRTRSIFPVALAEAERLRARGLQGSPAARALGISEAMRALSREIAQEEAVELMVQATRRYAKRQLTWFRKEKQIRWLAPGEVPSGIP